MLSWIILILVIAIVCLMGLMCSSYVFGRSELEPPIEEAVEVIAANRQRVATGDFGSIQIEVVKRGYRMDQVDALVEELTAQLDQSKARRVEDRDLTRLGASQKDLGVESTATSAPAATQSSEGELDLWQQ